MLQKYLITNLYITHFYKKITSFFIVFILLTILALLKAPSSLAAANFNGQISGSSGRLVPPQASVNCGANCARLWWSGDHFDATFSVANTNTSITVTNYPSEYFGCKYTITDRRTTISNTSDDVIIKTGNGCTASFTPQEDNTDWRYNINFQLILPLNCYALSGPSTIVYGQSATYQANFSGASGIFDNTGLVFINGTNCNSVVSSPTKSPGSTNPVTNTCIWAPPAPGTYTAYCRSWNDGISECRGMCVTGAPIYSCAGPNTTMTINVVTPTPTSIPTSTPRLTATSTPRPTSTITPTPIPACVPNNGNANDDYKVTPNDFAIWAYYFDPLNPVNGGPSVGDFNCDGYVNANDFSIWAYYFTPY